MATQRNAHVFMLVFPALIAGAPGGDRADPMVDLLRATSPAAVRLVSEFTPPGAAAPTQRHETIIAVDGYRADQWMLIPGVGESLIKSGTVTHDRSELLLAGASSVQRDFSGPDAMTFDGPVGVSPIPIIRGLDGAAIERISREGPDAPATHTSTYRGTPAKGSGAGVFEIDVADGVITGYRRGPAPGSYAVKVEYMEYRDFGDGTRYPTVILQRLPDPDGGELVLRQRIVEASNAPGIEVEPIAIPDGFFVMDAIEGVVTDTNGTVLGPIDGGVPAQPDPLQPPPAGSPLSLGPVAILLGVVLVLSGAVLAVRRAAGRG